MFEISAARSRIASLKKFDDTTDVLYNAKTQSYGPNTKPYGTFKGLLSGEISFKAWLFPDSTKKADRQATANQIANDLSAIYGVNKNSLQESLANSSNTFTKPILSNIVKRIVCVSEKQAKQAEQACPDKNLADALFNNQFRMLTEADKKIQSDLGDITQLSRQLRGTYNLKNPSQKAQVDAIFNAHLKSLSQPATPEYDAVTPEKLAAYHELGQMTANFKRDVLPTLQRRDNQATGAPSVNPKSIVQSSRIKISQGEESSQNPEEKAFDTAVKNFLDQNRNVTKEGLQAFFERYKSRIA